MEKFMILQPKRSLILKEENSYFVKKNINIYCWMVFRQTKYIILNRKVVNKIVNLNS